MLALVTLGWHFVLSTRPREEMIPLGKHVKLLTQCSTSVLLSACGRAGVVPLAEAK